MKFVKSIFLVLIVSATLFAEGIPFTISSADLPPPDEAVKEAKASKAKAKKNEAENKGENKEEEEKDAGPLDLTLRMKHQAVINYLQEHLGSRYPKYAEKVTPDFAERFIMEYKISRDPSKKEVVILSGSIDSDSLKRWLRKFEIKSQGGAGLSPLFFVSSDSTLRAHETATSVRSGIAEQYFTQLQHYFGKINSTLIPFQGSGLLTPIPARTESEIKALAELGQAHNANSAVWIHLSQCLSCGGSRADLLFYYFPQNRLALGRADDLPFDFREGATTERMRKQVKGSVDEFVGGVNDLIEQGTLFSSVHLLVVDGLDSLRAFKQLDNGLSKLDFVTRVVLKKTDSTKVEYEILSGLNTEELMQRLQNNAFGGFKLKATTGNSGNSFNMHYGRGT